jgi:hypothetical protein
MSCGIDRVVGDDNRLVLLVNGRLSGEHVEHAAKRKEGVALLKVLQEREFEHVGGTRSLCIDKYRFRTLA